MSIREIAYSMIDSLDEEQLNQVIVFIQNLPEKSKAKKPTVESLCGVLHEYAKPGLRNLEEGAWERDIVERIIHGDESF